MLVALVTLGLSPLLHAYPTIIVQPASVSALIGASTNFTVVATGTGPLQYQWRRNGINVGSDSSTYTVASVQNSTLGFYSVAVTDIDASTTSSNATLSVPLTTVNWAENFEWGTNGGGINGVNGWAASTAGVTISTAQAHGGTRSAYVADYSYRSYNVLANPIAAGTHSLVTFWMYDNGASQKEYCDVRDNSVTQVLGVSKNDAADSNGGTFSAWYQGRLYAGTISGMSAGYFSLTNAGSAQRSTGWHKHQVERVNGTTANWYIDGVLGRALSGCSTDAAWQRVVVGNGASSSSSPFYVDDISVEIFTGSSGTNPIIIVQPQSLSMTQGVAATLSVAAVPGGSYVNTDSLSYQWLKNGTGIPGAKTSSYSISNPQDSDLATYAVIVIDQGGTLQSQDAVLAIAPPTLDAQSPAGGPFAGSAGTDSVLSVSAHASHAISYQWSRNGSPLADGGNISGATATTLTVRGLGTSDQGTYSCLLTNADGFTNSLAVTLSVTTVPIINVQPANQTVMPGSNAAFTVTAAGPSLTYQWSRGTVRLTDSGSISGASSSALGIASVTALDAGSYTCLITNSYGSVTSNPAMLTLFTAPLITIQPASQTVFLTSNAVFHVAAQGSSPLSYRWKKDGLPLADGGSISGATTPDLTIQVGSWLDEGVYAVTVSNRVASVTSFEAELLAALPGLPSVWDIVNQYSLINYSNTLYNKLYTHQGMNRTDISGPQHDLCRSNIYAEFQRVGMTPYLDSYSFVDTNGLAQTGCNVIAVKPGILNPSNEIYVVSGHYDSTANHESGGWTSAPGADDNASGIACVLEMARLFNHYNFARTMVFCAFDNEEISDYYGAHRLGSVHYVSQHTADNIKGMISTDMIAWQSPVTLHNMADIEGRLTTATIRNALAAAITTYGGGLLADLRTYPGDGDTQGDWSDHVAFVNAGFQACLLIEDNWWSNPNYHHMSDYVENPGYIDWTYGGKMCRSAIGYFATQLQPVAEPAELVSIQPGTNGAIVVTCVGTPGCKYAIEMTANLRPSAWVPIQTNTASADGSLIVSDLPAGSRQTGFYRARWVP